MIFQQKHQLTSASLTGHRHLRILHLAEHVAPRDCPGCFFDFAVPPEVPCRSWRVKWLRATNRVAPGDFGTFRRLRTQPCLLFEVGWTAAEVTNRAPVGPLTLVRTVAVTNRAPVGPLTPARTVAVTNRASVGPLTRAWPGSQPNAIDRGGGRITPPPQANSQTNDRSETGEATLERSRRVGSKAHFNFFLKGHVSGQGQVKGKNWAFQHFGSQNRQLDSNSPKLGRNTLKG